MRLVEPLRQVDAAVGDVVAPRLRAIARAESDPEAAGRARAGLIEHLRRQHAGDLGSAVLDLDPAGALALLAELGHSTRGRPAGRSPSALTVRAEVWLSPAEAEALDTRRGSLSRSEYIARALGLRSPATG